MEDEAQSISTEFNVWHMAGVQIMLPSHLQFSSCREHHLTGPILCHCLAHDCYCQKISTTPLTTINGGRLLSPKCFPGVYKH